MDSNQSRNFAKAFTNMNILSDEEKASYHKFGQRVHNLDNESLIKLNIGLSTDKLNDDQKTIVALEVKLREIDKFKKNNVDLSKEFSVDNYHKNLNYDPEFWGEQLPKLMLQEQNALEGMTDELLEKSINIVDNADIVVDSNDFHKIGAGINYRWNKFVVKDENGDKIQINNKALQEHFRKMYIEKLSEITGIDYTQYDESPDIDMNIERYDNLDFDQSVQPNDNGKRAINFDDYEDD